MGDGLRLEVVEAINATKQARISPSYLSELLSGKKDNPSLWTVKALADFFGGITGVTIGTEQINIIAHNTLRIPGHFHATVVSGTAVAFMGATYYLLPLVFQRKVAFWKLAKAQPYMFAIGMLLVEFGMTFAGSFGVPRRHWDISFSQAPFDVPFNPAVDLFLAMVGIGGIIAVAGAYSFILIAVKSVFFGERITEFPRGAAAAINCLVEQKIDAVMQRTRIRPLPRGELTSAQTLVFAGVVGALGLWVLFRFVNPLTMWLTLATFVGYAVVYTVLLKPATPQNIVIGGASGAMPPVLGWAAMRGDVGKGLFFRGAAALPFGREIRPVRELLAYLLTGERPAPAIAA